MLRLTITRKLAISLALVAAAATANAETLRVNCGQHTGLTSIRAAVKAVKDSDSQGPATILVSGTCRENVVIQSIDRLTLTAVNHASITDASGGTLDVLDILDSRSVTINDSRSTLAPTVSQGPVGIGCGEVSLCRLNRNTIRGATDGSGIIIVQDFNGGTRWRHHGRK